MSVFVAIDFETADTGADSACSIGLVRVENGKITRKEVHLIRPPREKILFTHIHGIEWEQVKDSPDFGGVWPKIESFFEGVEFVAAHNVSFDHRVLHACCLAHGILPPGGEYLCTVQLARETWGLRPTRLPDVCRHLGITLKHHDALSDAEACARIVIAAMQGTPV